MVKMETIRSSMLSIWGVLFLLFSFYFLFKHVAGSSSDGKEKVIVFGGAGYIGSHVVLELLRDGRYDVLVFDDFSEGYVDSLHRVEKLTKKKVKFVTGNINDEHAVEKVFQNFNADYVFHLCAKISVHESTQKPLKYYENNVGGTVQILKYMEMYGVKNFVFSSTAAIFGNPESIPIRSDAQANPINPYGVSKLTVEKILKDCEKSWGLRVVSLRYFNAAGADESGAIGENHRIESHLIPIVIQAAEGKREKVYIFGDTYDTEDGTCVRDYVHVTDIARAHIKAAEYLSQEDVISLYVNLGSGKGNSVLEVINAVERVSGKMITREMADKREGDPPILVASSEDAERLLGWRRRYSDIEEIIRTAYNWHTKNPSGYGNRRNFL